MKLLDKILVATDFRPAATQTMGMANRVAKEFDATITLLHVIPDLEHTVLTHKEIQEAALQELLAQNKKFNSEGIKTTEPILDAGSVSERIIEHADNHDVNLIMMGAGDKDPHDKFPLGTNTDRVIRKSHKPVWVVKLDCESPIKKILCPVDLSTHSQRALKNAIHLARNFKAQLTVLHVVEKISESYFLLKKKISEKDQEAHLQQHKDDVDKFLKDFDFVDVQWEKMIRIGKPEDEILAAAAELNCALTVLGTLGINAQPRFILGSVAEKIIREVPSSLITVKYEDPIQLAIESESTDLESIYRRGRELLEKGFPQEAIIQFDRCLDQEQMQPRVWLSLSSAYERLGQHKDAQNAKTRAKEIRQKIEEQRIEAEIRKQHWFLDKK